MKNDDLVTLMMKKKKKQKRTYPGERQNKPADLNNQKKTLEEAKQNQRLRRVRLPRTRKLQNPHVLRRGKTNKKNGEGRGLAERGKVVLKVGMAQACHQPSRRRSGNCGYVQDSWCGY